MWTQINKEDNSGLDTVIQIMQKMASWYVDVINRDKLKRLIDNKSSRIYYYNDADVEIVMVFIWKPSNNMWKVAHYGYVGKDITKAVMVTVQKVMDFLIEQKQLVCYAVVPDNLEDDDVKSFYSEFKRVGWELETLRYDDAERWTMKLDKAKEVQIGQ